MKVGDLFNLTGKTALVTGCSRGIGQAMAVALAESGADIIGTSHSLEQGSDTEQKVLELGRKFTGFSADLSDRFALYDFVKQVRQQYDSTS